MFEMFTSIIDFPHEGSGICPDISSVDTTMDPTSIIAFPREGSGICKFNNCKY